MHVKIGTIILLQPKELMHTPEFSAWYRIGSFGPQKAQLLCDFSSEGEATFIRWKLVGEIMEEYLQNHYGGVPSDEPYDRKAKAGQPSCSQNFSRTCPPSYVKTGIEAWNESGA